MFFSKLSALEKRIMLFFFAVALFQSLPVFSKENFALEIRRIVEKEKIYNDPMWIALLHYKKKVNNEFVSEADGNNFFLSPIGKDNPKEELISDIMGFLASEENYNEEKMHPQCRFPARYKWIKSKLSKFNINFKDVKCVRFEEWSYLLRPRGMTIIYASGYLNNPASMFGHTFIRLDRREKTIETDLLSYAINYAAIPTTSNALLYAILGLTGGFEGRFSTLPYYMKVKEYGSMEHRDLWEYHLNVNQDQLDYVVKHIWELGQTYFDYYYIDENCSYHILSLIQIAFPELDFREHFSVYTVPQDTIKFLLEHKYIIKDFSYRPSLKSVAESTIPLLDSEELDIAIQIARSKKTLHIPEGFEKMTDKEKAKILDAASVLYRFYRGYGLPEEEEKEVVRIEKEILLKRAKLDVASEKIKLKELSPPHKAHGPAMISTGLGYGSDGMFEEIFLKPVLHDLLSREDGYEPLTQIDMLSTRLRFSNRYEKVFVDNFDFIRIVSFAEIHKWIRKLSWKLNLGAEADYRKEKDKLNYLNFVLKGGPGLSFSSHLFVRETYFLFLDNEIMTDSKLNFSLNSGVSAGMLLKFSKIVDNMLHYGIYYSIYSRGYEEGLIQKLDYNISLHLTDSSDIRLMFKSMDFNYYEATLNLALMF